MFPYCSYGIVQFSGRRSDITAVFQAKIETVASSPGATGTLRAQDQGDGDTASFPPPCWNPPEIS